MSQENVFRFLTVRPGSQGKKINRKFKNVPLYDTTRSTKLNDNLKRLHDAGASADEIKQQIREYQESPAYTKSLDGLQFDVNIGLQWLAENSAIQIKDLDLFKAIKTMYGRPAKELVALKSYKTTIERLSDTIVTEAFSPSWDRPTDGLIAARKFLSLIEMIAQGEFLDPNEPLGVILSQFTLSIPDFARLPAPIPLKETVETVPKYTIEEEEHVRLRKELRDLEEAHRELSRQIIHDDALLKTEYRAEPPVTITEIQCSLAHIVDEAEGARKLKQLISKTSIPSGGVRVRMKPDAIDGLSDVSKSVLTNNMVDLTKMDPTMAVRILEDQMQVVSANLVSTEVPKTVLLLGGVMMDSQKVKASFDGFIFDIGKLMKSQCHFQAGIGDLLMVKQTLKAYELAEFAHVENVLAGEARVREHRRLNIMEEIQVEEEEREIEKERNLQSTERNEMQAEAEKTVKSQFELDSGLQVSGSYGPAISFSANLNVGFNTSTEETQRKAISYSREVTEKTSERVRERIKKELRRRMLEQVEEFNRHSITNEPATNGHVRGIYRWLNKVYDAQIFNYGQRMMFEFVVPEPAAYLLYALIENPPEDNELVKPEAPTYNNAPLKPSHITRINYHDYIAKYQVRNVEAPPPQFRTVSTFDKQDKVEGGSNFGRSVKVEIPTGYGAYAASVMAGGSWAHTNHWFDLVIGNTHHRLATETLSLPYIDYGLLGCTYVGELAIAWEVIRFDSFALAVDVHCSLTSEGFAKWQQAVYDAIMNAYLVQKADYEEKIAALGIQQGVKILGRNPLENRRIEREELKKLVLMMLTHNNDISCNSMLQNSEPNIDLSKACANGNWIRFFENAFEWNNTMYVLYPYFWGRKARWISALHLTDPDPDFSAFLKAGAARVQVPVRPGFEKAVAYYCQFGVIWEGNDPPLRDDDLYVPIVDEIAENLGKLDDGVPYPKDSLPWEVHIPTSLILVQNLEEIPNIRDILTGNNVVITG